MAENKGGSENPPVTPITAPLVTDSLKSHHRQGISVLF
jgi:hypothetical protein